MNAKGKWVVGGVAFLFVALCCGGSVGGFQHIRGMYYSTPPLLQPAGSPKMVKSYTDGWKRYSFPDLKAEFDLFDVPKATPMEWSGEGEAFVYEAASRYMIGKGSSHFIDGIRYQPFLNETLSVAADSITEDMKETAEYENVVTVKKSQVLDGVPALLVRITYRYDGIEYVDLTLLAEKDGLFIEILVSDELSQEAMMQARLQRINHSFSWKTP